MKILKFLSVWTGGILGAAIPLTVFYFVWSWVVDQVPANEWAGLIKIAITFLMVAMGGTLTVMCAVGLGIVAAALVATAVDS